MGILKHLLFWPVTGPTFLARFSMEKVQGVVREELTDDARVKEGLMDLQLRLEMGEIDEEEYLEEEARFMEQLRQVRHWQEQFGMGVRGGVVQVASGEGARTEEAPEGNAEEEGPQIASAEGAEIDVSFESGDDAEEGGWSSGSSNGSGRGSSSS